MAAGAAGAPSRGAAGPYPPIEDYGIVGDLHSVALVGLDGSVDWMCLPHLDSPSVFAALLDARQGGRFRICAEGQPTLRQIYVPDTNVLVTRFLSPEGVGEVTDFMPLDPAPEARRRHSLVRRVAAVQGRVGFEVRCEPAFDYARAQHDVGLRPGGALFRSPVGTLALATRVPLRVEGSAAVARFVLDEGQRASFLLRLAEPAEGLDAPPDEAEADEAFRATVAAWRAWIGQCTYTGRWREAVHRSALALKLLTFKPTGAIAAAATTSLPEAMGGGRNWDYRYVWIRDAAFTIYALMRIGFTGEAAAFMGWLQERAKEAREALPIAPLHGVSNGSALEERTLDHLEGYRGAGPVRVGNAAAGQFQLDIYGALMDAAYLYNKHGTPVSHDLWIHLRSIADWVAEHWQEPDEGMWEVRGGRQHFVTSKVMCWVALDRAIRLATKRSFPASLERWRSARDAIYEEVMDRGWSEQRKAFVQRYGSEALDASALLMPLVFFLSPTDPRMLRTIEAIQGELAADHLVHRYRVEDTPDGLGSREGSFSLCTFWLVEALTRAGRLDEARLIFEKMLGYANHLGLYAEEIGPSGEALGNFPQALTHLALISAAFNLDRALGGAP